MADAFQSNAFQPNAFQMSPGGRRRRSYVEIDGRLVQVSGYAEAERLLTELRREEKAQEVDRKKLLKIVIKKSETVEAPKRGRKPEKPAEIEKRMDDRAEKMARLYAQILGNLPRYFDEEEEEEILLLSH